MNHIKPWIVCLSASLFFFYEFIQGNMFASIAEHIMLDFNIAADKMSILSSTYYASNVLFLFFAGSVLDHYSTKKTLLIAMLLCVICTFIFAQTHSFVIAFLCRFIIGIGSAFCFLGPVRLASKWFPPNRMAMITGIIVTFAMIGGMVAQYPLTKLINLVGWRSALSQTGWLGVILLIIMAVGIEEKQSPVFSTPFKKNNHRIFAKLSMCLTQQTISAALYTSLMNMGIAVFGAMMGALYLMQRLDIANETAAAINTFLFLGAIIGGPVIGFISDRLGLRIMPMKITAAFSLLFILLILYSTMTVTMMKLAFFCLGFFTAGQIISYALVAESTMPQLTATAISIISIITQGGYIIYQNMFGYLLARSSQASPLTQTANYSLSDFQTASIIIPVGLLIALSVLFLLKETFNHPSHPTRLQHD